MTRKYDEDKHFRGDLGASEDDNLERDRPVCLQMYVRMEKEKGKDKNNNLLIFILFDNCGNENNNTNVD